MFQSYSVTSYLETSFGSEYIYYLIDSDFTKTLYSHIGGRLGIITAICDEYNKRNIDVIPNLFLLMLLFCKQYKITFSAQLAMFKHPDFYLLYDKYYNDLEQYSKKMLILL